jgi:macrocin-O-methyltransferase TylF-like protien
MDTFAGLPNVVSDVDLHHPGDFGDTGLTAVRSRVGEQGVTYLAGLFAERFADIAHCRFSFVHVDADLYTSVKECADFFVPRLSRGGAILFDDYGQASCPGAKQAVDESLTALWLPTGQALYLHTGG